jgi:hypothetical protein
VGHVDVVRSTALIDASVSRASKSSKNAVLVIAVTLDLMRGAKARAGSSCSSRRRSSPAS